MYNYQIKRVGDANDRDPVDKRPHIRREREGVQHSAGRCEGRGRT